MPTQMCTHEASAAYWPAGISFGAPYVLCSTQTGDEGLTGPEHSDQEISSDDAECCQCCNVCSTTGHTHTRAYEGTALLNTSVPAQQAVADRSHEITRRNDDLGGASAAAEYH